MKKNKKLIKLKKKMKSTLDWLDVEEVSTSYFTIQRGKDEEIFKGVQIIPHNIYLDNPEEQRYRISKLRNVFNKLKMELFAQFVFSPINLDGHLNQLYIQIQHEEDQVIKEMLEEDIEKALSFKNTWKELQYFILIKGDTKNIEKFDKNYKELCFELENANINFIELNQINFEDMFAHNFESQLINDFYFSRGIFDLGNDFPNH